MLGSVIEEAPEIGCRVALVMNERTYKSAFWLQCLSRVPGREGQWVNVAGPYAQQRTAVRKLRERKGE